jgi:hypothetical protein
MACLEILKMFLGLETDNKQNRTDLEQAARFQVIGYKYWNQARLKHHLYDEYHFMYYDALASDYYRSARRLMGVE